VTDLPQRICPGCRVSLDQMPWALDRDLRASPECWHVYGQVAMFEHEHAERLVPLHQLGVDAYGAQHAGAPTPVIQVAYSLVGLHLALDRGLDGLAVRAVHQRMGKPRPDWPTFDPPADPGDVTVLDVLQAGAGAGAGVEAEAGSVDGHAAQLRRWAESVWAAWSDRHADVAALTGRIFPGEFGAH
jgi:hypothetical protein